VSGIELVEYPGEQDRLDELRAHDVPRLLLVAHTSAPPTVVSVLEDWVRRPADPVELRQRLRCLEQRACLATARPRLGDGGRLELRDAFVQLSVIEERLARVLVDRFGAVVDAQTLARSAFRDRQVSQVALRSAITRLRRRIEPLGLRVRSVRARGYVLVDPATSVPIAPCSSASAAGTPSASRHRSGTSTRSATNPKSILSM
jgi:DNA-binding response OmpR family regulator